MQKCLIVLGMHRSGTSAISGVLNKLGISLGSNLVIPDKYNDKGYFENMDIVYANDNILQTLGSSWDDLYLHEEKWFQHPKFIPHRDAVKKILKQEFCANELFCIKDPRVSILLPFWISILQEMNIEPFFIIPLRHPIEVAESLKTRDGFSIQKGLLLWMNSMLSVEHYSRSLKRSFFIFDDLLKYPADTIHRILNKFNIVLPNAKPQIDIIKKELLDTRLKHHNINVSGLNDDSPALISRFYTMLLSLSNNEKSDKNDFIAIDEIRGEYKKLSSLFYNQDMRNAFLLFKANSADLNKQIASLNKAVVARDGQINSLNQAFSARDGHIASLNQAFSARDGHIASLNKAVVARDGQIAALIQALSLRDGHIASLNESVIARDGQITALIQILSERDAQIRELKIDASEQEDRIRTLDQILNNREGELERIKSSRSWKVTKPLRFAGCILRGDWAAVRASLRIIRQKNHLHLWLVIL